MTPDLFTVPVQRTSSTPRPSTAKRGKRVTFNVTEGEDTRTIAPAGRDAWALGELISAGAAGCTPIDNPGPRWSGYVHKLKRIYGLNVETITEMHGGEYAGKHARYVLRSRVAFADPVDAARRDGGRTMSGPDDFDWHDEFNRAVVLRAYGSIAVHENPFGDVVIRQERDALEDEDHWVAIPVQDAEYVARAIIAKAAAIKAAPPPVRPPKEPAREPQLALPSPAPPTARPTVVKREAS